MSSIVSPVAALHSYFSSLPIFTFDISLQSLVLIQHLSSVLTSQPGLSSPSLRSQWIGIIVRGSKPRSPVGPGVGQWWDWRHMVCGWRVLPTRSSKCGSRLSLVIDDLYLARIFNTILGLCACLQGTPASEDYDPRKRGPQFVRASPSPLYELVRRFPKFSSTAKPPSLQLPLLHHYHPTVSLHARQLLASQPITSSPDLTLNTLSHFLDRFVYKNPKKPKSKGASAMQPAASAADGTGVRRVKGEVSGGALPNEFEFWKKRVEEVPVDEV